MYSDKERETKMNFNLVYDGKALENHEISAKDLSVAMMAIDDLLSEANATINGKKTKIRVKVKASFKTGSFGIDLAVTQPVLDIVGNLFRYSSSIVSAETILALLTGVVSAGVYAGLAKLLKFLRNDRPSKIVEREDGLLEVYKNNRYIKTEKRVLDLYQNHKIRKAFETLVSPVKNQDGIESVAFIKGKTVVLDIQKSEAQYFDCPEPSKEKQSESVHEISVTVVRPFFVAEKKWYVNDGQSGFYVAIEDEEFMRRVDDHEIVFGKGDILMVRMRKEQFFSADENKLKAEHFIEKVLGMKSPPKQTKLPGQSD